MIEEPKKIQIIKENGSFIIEDRMPLKVREIAGIAIASFGVTAVIIGWLVAIVYTLIFTFGYFVFRFMAWYMYFRIEIKDTGELIKSRFLLKKQLSKELIDASFNFANLSLNEIQRGNKIFHMLQYKNHKIYDMLLLTNESDVEILAAEIDKLRKSTGSNTT